MKCSIRIVGEGFLGKWLWVSWMDDMNQNNKKKKMFVLIIIKPRLQGISPQNYLGNYFVLLSKNANDSEGF